MMKIGFIGLGRMGGSMVERLLQGGHEVIAFDRDATAMKAAENRGAVGARSISSLVPALAPPRIVWVMVPAGTITTAVTNEASESMEPGDIIIDGGNSNYRDTLKQAEALKQKGIQIWPSPDLNKIKDL